MTVRLIDTPKKPPLEKAVQSKIMKYLKNFTLWSGDVITKDRWGTNGISDAIGCYNGRYVGIEVKRDKNGRPTPQQRIWLDNKKAVGGIIGVAFDIGGIKSIFKENGIDLDTEPIVN